MTGYGDDIPRNLKLFMVFIDRIGFPIMAFLMMFVLSTYYMGKLNVALDANTQALISMSVGMQSFQKQVNVDHDKMESDLKRLMMANRTA